MNKKIGLSMVAVGVMAVSALSGADNLGDMFSKGKVSGQIREFSISRSVDRSAASDYTRSANAIGGYLKYESADLDGFSTGAAFYATNGFLNDSLKTDYTQVDPTLLGKNNGSYSMLGEAFVQYKLSKTTIKAGRQKLDTPMLGSDDARMIPNLFEAYVLTSKDIPNTTLTAAHVNKFAQGTFGRAYGSGGILGSTGGYSSWDALNQVGRFKNMGSYAYNKETSGVSLVSVAYDINKDVKVQLWDFYAHDIMNIIYGQADLSWRCLASDLVRPTLSAQLISEKNAGDDIAGKIDSFYWATKLDTKIKSFTASFAYSQTGKNSATDNTSKNSINSTWGGMPAFTQGMVTRHQFLAGTKASKISATYDFKELGANVLATLYYANYDMSAYNGYTYGNAKESGFDIIYNPSLVKNLQLRLRANYADDFNVATTGATTSWDEYRFIVNYNF